MEPLTDFTETLTDIRGGICCQELTQALNKVVKAAMQTGKMGQISITLKIKPQGKSQVTIIDVIKSTIPEMSKPETFCFVDAQNNLTRSDPRQMNIASLKQVPQKEAVNNG